MKTLLKKIFLAGAATLTLCGTAMAQSVEVFWYGQAAFKITSPGGKTIMIDPWILQNPLTPPALKDLDAIGKIDVLLVTHAHTDHIADAPEIARRQKIPMYAPADLNATLATLGVLPAAQLPRFNKSGTITPAPGIKVTAVKAEHSSVYLWNNPATGKTEAHPGGEPMGYIIELENGFKIYHMGDTGLFGDMKFIAEYYKPDLVLIPIGGNFTTAPADAAYAVREWLKPKYVVPMHYGANPFGRGTPEEFQKALGELPGTKVFPIKPGEKISF